MVTEPKARKIQMFPRTDHLWHAVAGGHLQGDLTELDLWHWRDRPTVLPRFPAWEPECFRAVTNGLRQLESILDGSTVE